MELRLDKFQTETGVRYWQEWGKLVDYVHPRQEGVVEGTLVLTRV